MLAYVVGPAVAACALLAAGIYVMWKSNEGTGPEASMHKPSTSPPRLMTLAKEESKAEASQRREEENRLGIELENLLAKAIKLRKEGDYRSADDACRRIIDGSANYPELASRLPLHAQVQQALIHLVKNQPLDAQRLLKTTLDGMDRSPEFGHDHACTWSTLLYLSFAEWRLARAPDYPSLASQITFSLYRAHFKEYLSRTRDSPSAASAAVAASRALQARYSAFDKHGPSTVLLLHVLQACDLALADALLDAGVDVNAEGILDRPDGEKFRLTPLRAVTAYADARIVRFLVARGADTRQFDAERPEEAPLVAAAMFGRPEVVEVLLETPHPSLSVEVKAGLTIPELGALRGGVEIVRVYLRKKPGLNWNRTTNKGAGLPFLFLLVQRDMTAVVKLLLGNGVDTSRKGQGVTLLEFAMSHDVQASQAMKSLLRTRIEAEVTS